MRWTLEGSLAASSRPHCDCAKNCIGLLPLLAWLPRESPHTAQPFSSRLHARWAVDSIFNNERRKLLPVQGLQFERFDASLNTRRLGLRIRPFFVALRTVSSLHGGT